MKLRLSALLALSALSSLLTVAPASAHEPRAIGGGALHVAVGWRNEPAFTDTVNALDFIVTDNVAVTSIQLAVDLLYFKGDSTTDVQATVPLTDALRRDFSNPNRFNIWMRPTRAGVYGFNVKGAVNGVMVNEVFVCGAGTRDAGGHAFNCVSEPQDVPHGKNSK
jgi:hypothetical protein